MGTGSRAAHSSSAGSAISEAYSHDRDETLRAALLERLRTQERLEEPCHAYERYHAARRRRGRERMHAPVALGLGERRPVDAGSAGLVPIREDRLNDAAPSIARFLRCDRAH